MYVKQIGVCFSVLFISTITMMTVPSVGRCESTARSPQPEPPEAAHHVRSSLLRRRREAREGRQPGPRRGEESGNPPLSEDEHIQTETTGTRPERRPRPRMGHKPRKTEGESMFSSLSLSNQNCSVGKIRSITRGEFYITGHDEASASNVSPQPSSVPGLHRVRGQPAGGSEENWLQPVVECGADAMTLSVRRRRAAQLLLDRESESSVPLSQLPPHCGYSVQTSWRDLSLTARCDACHVTQEGDRYVLSLLWRGSPVKVSCPVSRMQPRVGAVPSLCCSLYGLTVRVQGPSATEELRVNVRGEWTPVAALAEQCGYTLERKDAEVEIAAPFPSCGITVKDGTHVLVLQLGGETFSLSCPVSPLDKRPQTRKPLTRKPLDISHQARELMQPLSESPEPLQWAPPFYLAPPYYPHPTYPLRPEAYHPPTPSPPAPRATFRPQPLPPADSQPDYQDYHTHRAHKPSGVHRPLSSTDEMEEPRWVYPDLQQEPLSERDGATAAGPSLQPPSHAFNPYYHYYHHPKIPLSGPYQSPDPGPEVPEELSTIVLNGEFPVLYPGVQQPEANSGQFSEMLPLLYTPLSSPTFGHSAPDPCHPLPYPLHYLHYIPYITRGEEKGLAPLHPYQAAETNLSFIYPVPHKHNMIPYVALPNADRVVNGEASRSEQIKHLRLSGGDDDEKKLNAPVTPLPPSYPSGPDLVAPPPPHLYYLHPYHYYQMYYGDTDSHASLTSSKKALDKRQTTPPSTKFEHDVQEFPLHPYYYYYQLYYQPEVTGDDQEVHLAGNMDSGKASGSQLPLSHPAHHVSCSLHELTSDPDIYTVPLDGQCGVSEHGFPLPVVDLCQVHGVSSLQQDHDNSPVRLTDCSSSPGEVRLHGMDGPTPPAMQSKPLAVQLRIATDQSFSSYHPEAHLPLSLVQGHPLYLEVSLLDPPDPDLVLLVHSCLAYTHTPYTSWMLVYDGCTSLDDPQLLPSPHSDPHHIRRIVISSFLSLPSHSPWYLAGVGHAYLDPEVYFLCWTEVCSPADADCFVGCMDGPNSDV
uniref:uncharacterized protein LOC109974640 isoform X2 n=1 Tax=Monopterus albus TaxID=43700 RepID=UPI0009B42E8B|nr:uncharacterized protein LOC109974640 isoform X2 [Monopterus albus]